MSNKTENKIYLIEAEDTKEQRVISDKELLNLGDLEKNRWLIWTSDGFAKKWINKGTIDEATALMINLTPISARISDEIKTMNYLEASIEMKGILSRLLAEYSLSLLKNISEEDAIKELQKDPTFIQAIFQRTIATFVPSEFIVLPEKISEV